MYYSLKKNKIYYHFDRKSIYKSYFIIIIIILFLIFCNPRAIKFCDFNKKKRKQAILIKRKN